LRHQEKIMPENQDDTPDSQAIKEYLGEYFAMQDLLSASVELFDLLSKQSPTPGERAHYWAQKLEVAGKLDLLSSKLEAYLQDVSSIRAPTQAELDNAQQLAKELAELTATEVATEETAKLIADALTGFNKKAASA
jgi:hypothetical protein